MQIRTMPSKRYLLQLQKKRYHDGATHFITLHYITSNQVITNKFTKLWLIRKWLNPAIKSRS